MSSKRKVIRILKEQIEELNNEDLELNYWILQTADYFKGIYGKESDEVEKMKAFLQNAESEKSKHAELKKELSNQLKVYINTTKKLGLTYKSSLLGDFIKSHGIKGVSIVLSAVTLLVSGSFFLGHFYTKYDNLNKELKIYNLEYEISELRKENERLDSLLLNLTDSSSANNVNNQPQVKILIQERDRWKNKYKETSDSLYSIISSLNLPLKTAKKIREGQLLELESGQVYIDVVFRVSSKPDITITLSSTGKKHVIKQAQPSITQNFSYNNQEYILIVRKVDSDKNEVEIMIIDKIKA